MAEKVILKVKVIPNAKKDEICGWHNGALKIKLNAQPEDGKANAALLKFLKKLGIEAELQRGLKSREKEVLVHNLTSEQVLTVI